jgi:hypothetical protein
VRRSLLAILLLACAGSLAPGAAAHQASLLTAEWSDGAGPDALRLTLRITPPEDADLEAQWPSGCTVTPLRDERDRRAALRVVELTCRDREGAIGTRWGRAGGVLRGTGPDGEPWSRVLPADAAGVTIPLPGAGSTPDARAAGVLGTLAHYVRVGAEHVLAGFDHLAFVLCLVLLVPGRPLLWLVTAFTVGHSLSLALAFLGLVDLPAAPVEATIALSIVFMAREVLTSPLPAPGSAQAGRDERERWHAGAVFAFGLVHGLGFASVLGDLHVDGAHALLALGGFNVGVEVGQLAFVAAVLLLLGDTRRVGLARQLRRAGAVASGGFGLFWAVQRIAAF